MKQSVCIIIIITLAGCTNKTKEWPQSERDKFTNSCVSKAMSAGNLLEAGVKKYCSCYQEKMENKFPDVKDLEKVKIEEITKTAEDCRGLLYQ